MDGEEGLNICQEQSFGQGDNVRSFRRYAHYGSGLRNRGWGKKRRRTKLEVSGLARSTCVKYLRAQRTDGQRLKLWGM